MYVLNSYALLISPRQRQGKEHLDGCHQFISVATHRNLMPSSKLNTTPRHCSNKQYTGVCFVYKLYTCCLVRQYGCLHGSALAVGVATYLLTAQPRLSFAQVFFGHRCVEETIAIAVALCDTRTFSLFVVVKTFPANDDPARQTWLLSSGSK